MQKTTMKQKRNPDKKKGKIKFSLLTVVLIICIIELLFGSAQNINKIISFKSKIKNLEDKRDEELIRNKQLKSEVNNFDSEMTLEAIARNNLKMAGEDEVLLIINKPQETTEEEKKENQKDRHKKNRR